MLNKPFWLKEVFRDAEGEGAGGASVAPEGDTQPVPNKNADLEARLARMGQAVDGLTQGQKDQAIRDRLAAHEGTLNTAVATADTGVDTAEQALATAYDEGEGLQIAKAQRALTESVAVRERASLALDTYKEKVKEAERRDGGATGQPGQQQQRPAGDNTNLKAWKTKHETWYGVDADMTKASHEIDRQIREANVLSVGSSEYYNAIDRQMSQKYPDRFGGTPATGGTGQPVDTVSTLRKGKIQQSIADGYRRMGIDMSDPKVVERMVANRAKLAAKGILPEQPVQGRITTG